MKTSASTPTFIFISLIGLSLFVCRNLAAQTTTIQALVDNAPNISDNRIPPPTVKIPQGIYRETVTIKKRIILEPVSGATVEIRGSDDWKSVGWEPVNTTPPRYRSRTKTIEASARRPFGSADNDQLDQITHPEQVFRVTNQASIELRQVFAESQVVDQSTFYVDSTYKIVVGFNPADLELGETLEVTARQNWIKGESSDVTIRKITMRHAASSGAAGLWSGGIDLRNATNTNYTNWIIEECDLSQVHGSLIYFQEVPKATIKNNILTAGGFRGIGYDGQNMHHPENWVKSGPNINKADPENFKVVIEGNKITACNYLGFPRGDSAGAMKLTRLGAAWRRHDWRYDSPSTNSYLVPQPSWIWPIIPPLSSTFTGTEAVDLDVIFKGLNPTYKKAETVVANNIVRDNYGIGIWFDVDCCNCLIEDNVVIGNSQFGIHYEISAGGTIINNRCWGNGFGGVWRNGQWIDSRDDLHNFADRGLQGAGIALVLTEFCKVSGNICAWNGDGIVVMTHDRPGPGWVYHQVRNAGRCNIVSDNKILSSTFAHRFNPPLTVAAPLSSPDGSTVLDVQAGVAFSEGRTAMAEGDDSTWSLDPIIGPAFSLPVCALSSPSSGNRSFRNSYWSRIADHHNGYNGMVVREGFYDILPSGPRKGDSWVHQSRLLYNINATHPGYYPREDFLMFVNEYPLGYRLDFIDSINVLPGTKNPVPDDRKVPLVPLGLYPPLAGGTESQDRNWNFDKDTILNRNETENGRNAYMTATTHSEHPGWDTDGDGLTDGEEAEDGTDPNTVGNGRLVDGTLYANKMVQPANPTNPNIRRPTLAWLADGGNNPTPVGGTYNTSYSVLTWPGSFGTAASISRDSGHGEAQFHTGAFGLHPRVTPPSYPINGVWIGSTNYWSSPMNPGGPLGSGLGLLYGPFRIGTDWFTPEKLGFTLILAIQLSHLDSRLTHLAQFGDSQGRVGFQLCVENRKLSIVPLHLGAPPYELIDTADMVPGQTVVLSIDHDPDAAATAVALGTPIAWGNVLQRHTRIYRNGDLSAHTPNYQGDTTKGNLVDGNSNWWMMLGNVPGYNISGQPAWWGAVLGYDRKLRHWERKIAEDYMRAKFLKTGPAMQFKPGGALTWWEWLQAPTN